MIEQRDNHWVHRRAWVSMDEWIIYVLEDLKRGEGVVDPREMRYGRIETRGEMSETSKARDQDYSPNYGLIWTNL